MSNLAFKSVMTKPMASICITCYNQVRYVAEAVESALNQDYPNLEIVVCDDCSTDGTDRVAQVVIENYKKSGGAHQVIFCRNEKQLGVVKNYEKCFKLAHGELLITGAGDDVSLPNRASRLVAVWLASERTVSCFVNDMFLIDEVGKVIGTGSFAEIDENHPLGAVMAYDHRIISDFPEIDTDDAFEDGIFVRRARMLGDFKKIQEKLVKYRAVGLCSGFTKQSMRKFREQASRRTNNCLIQALKDLEFKKRELDTVKYVLLREDFERMEQGTRYEYEMIVASNIFFRLLKARVYLKHQYGNASFLSKPFAYVVLPRILPEGFYKVFKAFGVHRILRLVFRPTGLKRAE